MRAPRGRSSSGELLCARHVRKAEVYERIALLRGIVLSSELFLGTRSLRRTTNRTLLLRYPRARATREPAPAYEIHGASRTTIRRPEITDGSVEENPCEPTDLPPNAAGGKQLRYRDRASGSSP